MNLTQIRDALLALPYEVLCEICIRNRISVHPCATQARIVSAILEQK